MPSGGVIKLQIYGLPWCKETVQICFPLKLSCYLLLSLSTTFHSPPTCPSPLKSELCSCHKWKLPSKKWPNDFWTPFPWAFPAHPLPIPCRDGHFHHPQPLTIFCDLICICCPSTYFLLFKSSFCWIFFLNHNHPWSLCTVLIPALI
jgi:hypothetical protein